MTQKSYSNLQSIVTDGSLQNLSYTYDNVGNVTQITDSIAGETTTFGYDDRDRLTSASGPYTASYSYDTVGRMTAKTEGATVYTDMLYNGPRPHALAEVKDGAQTIASFGYDANGNMTSKTEGSTTTTYTYNAENRLTSRDDGPGTVTYVYDGLGKLVKKTDGSGTTVYIGGVTLAPHSSVAIGHLYEKNVTSGQITKYYWAFGRRVAMDVGGTRSFVLADH